jgi:serine/threonine protein phosphatase PrpC
MSRHKRNHPGSPRPDPGGPPGPATVRANGRPAAPSEPPRARPGEPGPNQVTDRRNAAPPEMEIAKVSDVGRLRPHNEDFVDCYVPADPEQLERKGAIYLVADGMGGHQAGEVASQGAVEAAIREYYADLNPDVASSLARAFRLANQRIYEQAQADPAKGGMGTTLVAAVILGRQVYVANVGDSRAYLVGQKGITQITEDHSWVEEQVRAGLLTAEQARRHPQRNLVTRALGTKPAVEVDLFEGQMNPGDQLLLCTDGLTNHVEPVELEAVLRENSPQQAAEILISRANERGGSDNITVLIVGGRRMTVPAPMPVAASRRWPLIPILAGVGILLAVAAAAALLFSGILKPDATPVPSASVEVVETVTLVPEETVTSAPEETVASEPTTPLSAATLAPTAGLLAPVGATAPSEGNTTGGSPTTTLVPPPAFTPTLSPQSPLPTATLANQPTVALPTRTPQVNYPRPSLQEPTDGSSLRGRVTFRWSYPRNLGANEAFEVLIWPQGQPHLGAAAPVTQKEQTIDLDVLFPPRGWRTGEYLWSVVVRKKDSQSKLSPEASAWRFIYTGGEEPEEKPPLLTPEPPPPLATWTPRP